MTNQNPPFRFIGQPLPRNEDARLLTGRGQFSDDFSFPGQAYAAMIRSPHAHARIVHIDGSNARKMPGVLGVFTGADCLADGLGAIQHDPLPKTKYDMKLQGPGGSEIFIGPHLLLPHDKARHVGEAIAMVVAESQAQAFDAAEAVTIDYEELPCVVHSEDAMKPGAPTVWDEVPDNVLVDTRFGNAAEVDQLFSNAPHVVSMDFHIGRVTGAPMEPRTAVAQYDKTDGRYTIYAGSGGAVRQKRELAGVLGVDPENIRVLSYDVGGNFGTRNRVYVEFGLVLWAARKLGRPVKYTATRSECFISDYQGRDLVAKYELVLDKRGRFLALRATNISNAGARCVSLSPLSKGAGLITGSYNIPAASLRAVSVFTNTVPTQAYRSSGRPEVTFAIERLIDIAAKKSGIDRVTLRRRNLVRPQAMPYRNAVGMLYDSGLYEDNMDLAMRLADWDGFKGRKREAKKHGKLLGLGLANYVEILNRRAKRANTYQSAAGSPRRGYHRHPTSGARSRDQLRASDRGLARYTRRNRSNHSWRYRCGESRGRNSLWTFHAPRRDRLFYGRERIDRQGQACGCGDPGYYAGSRRLQRRMFCCAREQSQLRFS